VSARILLVTGSRALRSTNASESWARTIIESVIGELPETAVVVTGDAIGPDRWALRAASWRGLRTRAYRLDGVRFDSHNGLSTRWCEPEQIAALSVRRLPLERNRVMVQQIAGAGGDWTTLALFAPWAKRHGTAHTVQLVRDAGGVVVDHTCPAECRERR
jgi:hypothetical protein